MEPPKTGDSMVSLVEEGSLQKKYLLLSGFCPGAIHIIFAHIPLAK